MTDQSRRMTPTGKRALRRLRSIAFGIEFARRWGGAHGPDEARLRRLEDDLAWELSRAARWFDPPIDAELRRSARAA